MSKVSRNQLKALVKECLFEILLESTDGTDSQALAESRVRKTKSAPRSKPRATKRPGLDSISFGNSKKKKAAKPLDVSAITTDPVMASIFQDTAMTTLVEQRAAESHGSNKRSSAHGDAAARQAAGSDPVSLFGDAASNWAALAFDKQKNTR